MIGADARYKIKGLELRGQLYYTNLSNTEQYNVFTKNENAELNDLGSSMVGYYAEAGYDILRYFKSEMKLVPFIRYEFLNTHQTVESVIPENPRYKRSIITSGLTLALTQGAVVKVDIQFDKNGSTNAYSTTFNAGLGIMF